MSFVVASAVNVSEGRRSRVIQEIIDAFPQTKTAKVLHVDIGRNANRTVITIAGNGAEVVDGLFHLIKRANELIDMSTHTGVHPRMGAVDVCPFAPLGVTKMDYCVELAHFLAKRLAEELNLPSYLYDYAAQSEWRNTLPIIRKGEYEALKEKLLNKDWKPDYGSSVFNPRFGAIAIAAQEFLIAYNVNLNTKDALVAKWIAAAIRESGGVKRSPDGKPCVVDGKVIKEKGLLRSCRAIGWYIDDYSCAQVSINLTNFKVTGMHDAFEACKSAAAHFGVEVTGSELVGLVPKAALQASGEYYLKSNKIFADAFSAAESCLGLSSIKPFIPSERVIEQLLNT